MATGTREPDDMKGKFHRQLDIFDPSQSQPQIQIIGAGGIGSFAALALSKLGLNNITVYDRDNVEQHNQPNQLYGRLDIDRPKVRSLEEIVGGLSNDIEGICAMVTEETDLSGIVISAVDSIDARRVIWGRVKENMAVSTFIDARIGGEVVKVIHVNPFDSADIERYEKTLHSNEEVAPLPCTAQAVIDVGFAVASLITRAVRLFIKDKIREFQVTYDARNAIMVKNVSR